MVGFLVRITLIGKENKIHFCHQQTAFYQSLMRVHSLETSMRLISMGVNLLSIFLHFFHLLLLFLFNDEQWDFIESVCQSILHSTVSVFNVHSKAKPFAYLLPH